MKKITILSLAVLAVALTFAISDAGWLIYHKPEFKGKVVDADTKEPIEGAVVVVVYNKHTLIGGPGGGYSTVIHISETLSDKNGEFKIPSYTTIIQPLSKGDYSNFIIYKPGYKSIGIKPLSDLPASAYEIFFSERSIGKQGEIKEGDPEKTYKVTFGIAELSRAMTKEERLRAIPGIPGDPRFDNSSKLPLFYKAVNEERRRFNLQEVGGTSK